MKLPMEDEEKLALDEQETIINFNRGEKLASVFTYDKKWQKRMKELGCKQVEDNGFGAKEYEIDKKRISMPRAPRKAMSEEQKAALGVRLQKARKAPSRAG